MSRRKLNIDPEEVEKLAGAGLTIEEIALSLGISESAFLRHRKQKTELELAIKKGKIEARVKVSNRLFELAMSGNIAAIIWIEKTRFGISDKHNTSDNELVITIKREEEKATDFELPEVPPLFEDPAERLTREVLGSLAQ